MLPLMARSKLLFHFLAIVDANSISAAARTIGITQPALTRSMKELEDMLGVTLFERRPQGVVLTIEGEILGRSAKLMRLEYQHAVEEISERTQGIAGRLRVAAGPVWTLAILPPIIPRFRKLFPHVRVTLIGGGFETQIQQLLAGDIDCVCGTLDDSPSHDEIIKESLGQLCHAVIGRVGHPLMKRGKVSPKELSECSWAVMASDPTSVNRINGYFGAHGLEPANIAVETDSLGVLAVVRASDFLTTYADLGLPTLEQFGLGRIDHEGVFWKFNAGFMRRRSSRPNRALDSFYALLRTDLPALFRP